MLPGIRIFDPEGWAEGAARFVAERVRAAVDERGACRLALAGGSSPRPVYQTLAGLKVPWPRVSLFWGDERCVPGDHPDSNFAMAKAALLDRINIPTAGIYRIEGERPMAEAAKAYTLLLDREPIDLVLLGMGGDGHVASLFPGHDIGATGLRAIPVIAPQPPRERVSMSLRAINESAEVIVLMTGVSKAACLRKVHGQIRSGQPRLPAARVRPVRALTWLLDTEAATQLENP